jgi:hypothetical protein
MRRSKFKKPLLDPALFTKALDPGQVAAVVRRFHAGQFGRDDMLALYAMPLKGLRIVARAVGVGPYVGRTKTDLLGRIERAWTEQCSTNPNRKD